MVDSWHYTVIRLSIYGPHPQMSLRPLVYSIVYCATRGRCRWSPVLSGSSYILLCRLSELGCCGQLRSFPCACAQQYSPAVFDCEVFEKQAVETHPVSKTDILSTRRCVLSEVLSAPYSLTSMYHDSYFPKHESDHC